MAFEVQWKRGYRPRVSAQVAAQEVKAIEQREGVVSPTAVVEAARAPEAPLHRVFTWDDEKAAESWRVTEARRMLSHLVVVEVVGDDRKPVGPAFVSVEVAKDEDVSRGYVSIDVAQRDPAMQDQAVREAIRQLKGWRRRYEQMQSLFPSVFRAIDDELSE